MPRSLVHTYIYARVSAITRRNAQILDDHILVNEDTAVVSL